MGGRDGRGKGGSRIAQDITPIVGGFPLPVIQFGAVQDLSYNAAGGASAKSAAFQPKTDLVLISAHITGSGVRIAVGGNPTAGAKGDGASTLLPASGWYYIHVPAGQNWALAAVSDDTNTGYLSLTEAATVG